MALPSRSRTKKPTVVRASCASECPVAGFGAGIQRPQLVEAVDAERDVLRLRVREERKLMILAAGISTGQSGVADQRIARLTHDRQIEELLVELGDPRGISSRDREVARARWWEQMHGLPLRHPNGGQYRQRWIGAVA